MTGRTVLFILRDMNCRHERDLCADLRRDGSGWRTWNNIGRWTKALLDGDGEYPWDMSSPSRAAQLRRVAVMNLKKEGGGSRASGSQLLDAVQMQHGKILEEICLCDPGMIICCGLASSGDQREMLPCLKIMYCRFQRNGHPSSPGPLTGTWQYYFTEINKKQIPVISFCHPQVTNLNCSRGHENLFIPLFQDMLYIKELFLKNTAGSE